MYKENGHEIFVVDGHVHFGMAARRINATSGVKAGLIASSACIVP